MSIQELSSEFKAFLAREDVLLAGLIVAVALSSYGLGRFSASFTPEDMQAPEPNQAMVQGVEQPRFEESEIPALAPVSEGGYVASKNGTKYHLPWCGSAKQIKEENRVWFTTKEEAEKAGYQPAANCPGI